VAVLEQLRDLGVRISGVTERWIPDAWVICMALTSVVMLLAIAGAGAGVEETVLAWGSGVWTLLGLAMQFTIALVAAHACVSSPAAFALLDRLASLPDPEKPRQAVLLAGLFSVATGFINAPVCTVGSALFVPFVMRRNPNADVRVLIAAAYLGLGTVWHGGLAATAPLIMATPDNPLLSPEVGAPIVDRLYPVTETLFNFFNLVYLPIIGAVGIGVLMLLHPTSNVRTFAPERIAAILPNPPDAPAGANTPAGRLEDFRGWVWFPALLLLYPLGHKFMTLGFGKTWNMDSYNIVFLSLALILHGRVRSFLAACREGIDTTWALVLQFPFYAGIFGIMLDTALGDWLTQSFSTIATETTWPFVVYVYSGIMNIFVPSAGSKWLIEAPYLIPVGESVGVSPTTVLLAYCYGDSTTNLIHPMWALPLLTVTRTRFGDVVGYTFLAAVACFVVSSVAMFLIPSQL
jgi:short-chain fatty acids transporter